MTAVQRETLEKYDDCVNEMHSIMELEIFSYAFRLGSRLMLATLVDNADGVKRKRPHSRQCSLLYGLSVGTA